MGVDVRGKNKFEKAGSHSTKLVVETGEYLSCYRKCAAITSHQLTPADTSRKNHLARNANRINMTLSNNSRSESFIRSVFLLW